MRTTSKTNSKRIHKVMICLIIFALGVSMSVGCTSNNNAEYELTITIGGAGNGTVTGAGKFEVGETVVVTATVTAGYTFDGWYDGADKKSDSLEYTFAMPAKNLTLTAKFDADTGNIRLLAALSKTSFIDELNNAKIMQITSNPGSVLHFGTVERDGDKAYCYSYYDIRPQQPEQGNGYYLERISGESYYYFRYYFTDGAWHKDLATERYYLSYNFTFDIFSILEKLNAEDFTQDGEYYKLKPSAYEAFGQMPECEGSNYKSVSLRLQNGKITEFKFDCNYSSMESVTTYTYVISDHNAVSVTLPQDYVDDAALFEDYKRLALTLSGIYSYETTNFTLDTEQTVGTTTIKGKLCAYDFNNFGLIGYSDADEIITGTVYAKENGIYYIYTFDENGKVWTKTESDTANTLETIFGLGWKQMSYSTLLSTYTSQRGQTTISEGSMTYCYEGEHHPSNLYMYLLIQLYDIESTKLYIPEIGG